ncbi:hypothetical protein IQ266_16875 [filamentous cyanobacterium LEGE 11480]|uniref:Uncharacterized protein n=1 Tax=Romeriopsis navalis LEGE 11480 TaxID=2777977 RepID=A0A928VN74_9CYAN|nr:hypothetical protein [Romeriopsis navalis]MBE9031410.1 hypothetical protein [Romeriopsis navalis LEGE 11480]
MIRQTTKCLYATLLLVNASALPTDAQVIIRSNGVITGTVTPPNKNPNFNQGTTRIDTDSQGRYFRNGVLVFDAQTVNPNLVRIGSNGQFFVDFRGIPVVSTDGSLTSDILRDGQLESIQRFNNDNPVKYWGNIQDEFVVRGSYTGTAMNPNTGEQYQGTFDIRGQGPRYSDSNGGLSPTVFDFRSYYNFQANPQIQPTPTVSSYTVHGMPVELTVTIPAGLSPITPTAPFSPSTPTPFSPSPPTAPLIPPTNFSPLPTAVFDNNPLVFDINPLILDQAQPQPIGPTSRILLP